MNRVTNLLAVLLFTAVTLTSAHAQTLYWDINGANAGATDNGDGTAPGTWGTDSFWSTDSTGLTGPTGAWVSGNTAVFSAGTNATGTYTVDVANGTTQSVSGITLEEGNVTLGTGLTTQTISLGSNAVLSVAPSKTLTIASVLTSAAGAGQTITGGGKVVLQGAQVSGVSQNAQAGPVLINGGSTLQLTISGDIGLTSAGSGDITINNGTLANTATTVGGTFLTSNRNINIGSGGATLSVPGATTAILSYSGIIIGGSNPLHISGLGEFRAGSAGKNWTFGNLFVDSGLYLLGGSPAGDELGFGAVNNTVTMAAGAAIGSGISVNSPTTRSFVIGPGSGGADVGFVTTAGVTWTINSVISGNGTLYYGQAGFANSQSSSGVYTITGNNTYTGNTKIRVGVVNINTTGSDTSGTGYGAITVESGFLAGSGNIGHNVSGSGTDGFVTVTGSDPSGPGRIVPGVGLANSHTMQMRGLDVQSGGIVRTFVDQVNNNSDWATVTAADGLTLESGSNFEIRTTNNFTPGTNWFTGGTYRMMKYNGSVTPNTSGFAIISTQQPSFESDGAAVVTNETNSADKHVDVVLKVVDRAFNNSTTSGNWSDQNIWDRVNNPGPNTPAPQSEPNATSVIAEFNDASTTAHTITVDGAKTLGVLNFNSPNSSYTIDGSNAITLATIGADAQVNDLNGSHLISAPIAQNATTQYTVTNAADTLEISGAVSGASNMNVNGAGTLKLSGANTYTGRSIINSGATLSVSSDANLGALPTATAANNITLNGGTLKTTATFTISTTANTFRGVTVNAAGGTFNVALGTVLTVNSLITDSTGGVVTITGGGDFSPNISQTAFTNGKWKITGGARWVNLSNQNRSGPTPANFVQDYFTLDNGTYFPNNSHTPDSTKGWTMGPGGGIIDTSAGTGTMTINNGTTNGIAGPGSLTKVGTQGTLTLSSPNTFAGSLNMFATGGTLNVNAANGFTGNTINVNGSGGALTLALANTFTGNVNVMAGTLTINGSANTPGALNVSGGTATLAAANTFSGGVNLSGGRINFNNAGAAGSGAGSGTITVSNSPNFATSVAGPTALPNSVVLTSGATPNLLAPSGDTLELDGAISGGGSLNKTSAGAAILTGNNSYSNGTTVTQGTLTVQGASAKLGTGNVTVNGTNASTFLSVASGVTNAIADAATLSLAGGGTAGVADQGYINLGSGINDVVAALLLGGVAQVPGTYGSSSSSATFRNDDYFAGLGIITVPSACAPGDLNCDGHVDAGDYVFWRKNNGPASDYDNWRANFGNPPGAGAGTSVGNQAVPEPSTLLLSLVAVFFALAGRRHW